MAFTREAIFLKATSSTDAYAFLIQQEGYQGQETKPASYGRSLYDGGLLAVRGTSKKTIQGIIIVYDSPTGRTSDGDDYKDYGSIDQLKACWQSTTLTVKAHGDSAYWEAEWFGPWPPQVDFDPLRGVASVPISLEEK